MTSFNAPPKFSRQVLLLAASIFLLAAPQGALAKHKDHSDDHGGMSSNDSSEDHGDKQSEDPKDKVSEKHKGKNKEESADNGMDSKKQKSKHKDKESAENGMDSEEHQGKDKEHDEKTTDTEQDKTTGTAPTGNGNTPTADGDLFHKGVVGQTPTDITPVDQGTASGPGSADKIHPISSPPPRVVTISVGAGSFQIPDGPGGIIVSSTSPGTITISNGHDSKTLGAGSLTVSGTLGIGRGYGVQVGPTNGEGKTVIAVNPPPPPAPLPHPGMVTNGSPFDDFGKAVGGAAAVVFDPFF